MKIRISSVAVKQDIIEIGALTDDNEQYLLELPITEYALLHLRASELIKTQQAAPNPQPDRRRTSLVADRIEVLRDTSTQFPILSFQMRGFAELLMLISPEQLPDIVERLGRYLPSADQERTLKSASVRQR